MTRPASIHRALQAGWSLLAALALSVASIGTATAKSAAQSASPPTPPPTQPESSVDVYAEFKRLFDAREHAAAVEAGRKVVALTEQEQSQGTETLQVALMNLGLAQQLAGDYLAAEQSYLRAIALIEAAGRMTSPRLARAQAGLATAYYSARRYDLAAPALDRAVALSRRSEGLFNEDQLPRLAKQADSLTQLGQLEQALQARRYAVRLVERKHGQRSLRFAQELESLGRWYSVVAAYEASRSTLLKSLRTVEELEGPGSIDLVGPLTRSPTMRSAGCSIRWLARRRPARKNGARCSTIGGRCRACRACRHRRSQPRDCAGSSVRRSSRARVRNRPRRWSQPFALNSGTGSRRASSSSRATALPAGLARRNAGPAGRRPPAAGADLRRSGAVAVPAGGRLGPLRAATGRRGGTPPRRTRVDGRCAGPRAGRQGGVGCRGRAFRGADRGVDRGGAHRPRFSDGEPVATSGVRFMQPVFALLGEVEEQTPPPPEPAAGQGTG